jgi:hypothetical protein
MPRRVAADALRKTPRRGIPAAPLTKCQRLGWKALEPLHFFGASSPLCAGSSGLSRARHTCFSRLPGSLHCPGPTRCPGPPPPAFAAPSRHVSAPHRLKNQVPVPYYGLSPHSDLTPHATLPGFCIAQEQGSAIFNYCHHLEGLRRPQSSFYPHSPSAPNSPRSRTTIV